MSNQTKRNILVLIGIVVALVAIPPAVALECSDHSADGAVFAVYIVCEEELVIAGEAQPEPVAAAESILQGHARVIDGDTIDIGDERIRLQGVDTPESGQTCRDVAGDEYRCGRAATEALRALIGTGTVRCEIEGRGKYGRAIGTCFTADGTDINGWLVRQGYGLAYRK